MIIMTMSIFTNIKLQKNYNIIMNKKRVFVKFTSKVYFYLYYINSGFKIRSTLKTRIDNQIINDNNT